LEVIAGGVMQMLQPKANVVQDDGEVKFCSCTMNPEDKERCLIHGKAQSGTVSS